MIFDKNVIPRHAFARAALRIERIAELPLSKSLAHAPLLSSENRFGRTARAPLHSCTYNVYSLIVDLYTYSSLNFADLPLTLICL